jgi:hypothetical protein
MDESTKNSQETTYGKIPKKSPTNGNTPMEPEVKFKYGLQLIHESYYEQVG